MYGKALEIKPMKVWKLPKDKEYLRKEICINGEYFGQIKKDGFWYMFEKDIEGNCFLFSRVISKQTGHLTEKSANVPHIISSLNGVPNGTIIIGEIYYPEIGMTSKDVSKIMGSLPDKAIQRQEEYGKLHYYVYDILQLAGELLLNKTNWSRYCKLELVYNVYGLKQSPYIELAEVFEPHNTNLDMMIDELINSGEEGMVLKSYYGKYIPDKKPAWNMIKFKREDDADVICLGFDPPTKEYSGKELENWQYWEETSNGKIPITKPYAKGWIGAIKIGVIKNGEIIEIGTVSSGLTDEICEAIKADPMNYIGKPLSVKYMQTYEEALRHPVFVRWREDLNQSDCAYEKIFC